MEKRVFVMTKEDLEKKEEAKPLLNFIKKYQSSLTAKRGDVRLSTEEAGLLISSIFSLLLNRENNSEKRDEEKREEKREEKFSINFDQGFFKKNS